MNKLSTRFLAQFIGISFCILAILFSWITMITLTANLLIGTLTPLFLNNITPLIESKEIAMGITYFIVVIFSILAAFAFEGAPFWFIIQNEKIKSYFFAFISGTLTTAGMLRKINFLLFDYSAPQTYFDILVYFIIGFMFQILVFNLSHVLFKKLNEKTKNNETILQIMQTKFQKDVLELLLSEKVEHPKVNRFDVLLGGLAPDENETINTTYKSKYANGFF